MKNCLRDSNPLASAEIPPGITDYFAREQPSSWSEATQWAQDRLNCMQEVEPVGRNAEGVGKEIWRRLEKGFQDEYALSLLAAITSRKGVEQVQSNIISSGLEPTVRVMHVCAMASSFEESQSDLFFNFGKELFRIYRQRNGIKPEEKIDLVAAAAELDNARLKELAQGRKKISREVVNIAILSAIGSFNLLGDLVKQERQKSLCSPVFTQSALLEEADRETKEKVSLSPEILGYENNLASYWNTLALWLYLEGYKEKADRVLQLSFSLLTRTNGCQDYQDRACELMSWFGSSSEEVDIEHWRGEREPTYREKKLLEAGYILARVRDEDSLACHIEHLSKGVYDVELAAQIYEGKEKWEMENPRIRLAKRLREGLRGRYKRAFTKDYMEKVFSESRDRKKVASWEGMGEDQEVTEESAAEIITAQKRKILALIRKDLAVDRFEEFLGLDSGQEVWGEAVALLLAKTELEGEQMWHCFQQMKEALHKKEPWVLGEEDQELLNEEYGRNLEVERVEIDFHQEKWRSMPTLKTLLIPGWRDHEFRLQQARKKYLEVQALTSEDRMARLVHIAKREVGVYDFPPSHLFALQYRVLDAINGIIERIWSGPNEAKYFVQEEEEGEMSYQAGCPPASFLEEAYQQVLQQSLSSRRVHGFLTAKSLDPTGMQIALNITPEDIDLLEHIQTVLHSVRISKERGQIEEEKEIQVLQSLGEDIFSSDSQYCQDLLTETLRSSLDPWFGIMDVIPQYFKSTMFSFGSCASWEKGQCSYEDVKASMVRAQAYTLKHARASYTHPFDPQRRVEASFKRGVRSGRIEPGHSRIAVVVEGDRAVILDCEEICHKDNKEIENRLAEADREAFLLLSINDLQLVGPIHRKEDLDLLKEASNTYPLSDKQKLHLLFEDDDLVQEHFALASLAANGNKQAVKEIAKVRTKMEAKTAVLKELWGFYEASAWQKGRSFKEWLEIRKAVVTDGVSTGILFRQQGESVVSDDLVGSGGFFAMAVVEVDDDRAPHQVVTTNIYNHSWVNGYEALKMLVEPAQRQFLEFLQEAGVEDGTFKLNFDFPEVDRRSSSPFALPYSLDSLLAVYPDIRPSQIVLAHLTGGDPSLVIVRPAVNQNGRYPTQFGHSIDFCSHIAMWPPYRVTARTNQRRIEKTRAGKGELDKQALSSLPSIPEFLRHLFSYYSYKFTGGPLDYLTAQGTGSNPLVSKLASEVVGSFGPAFFSRHESSITILELNHTDQVPFLLIGGRDKQEVIKAKQRLRRHLLIDRALASLPT